MTNEEKVEQYFQEIDEVFGVKERALNALNAYDKFKADGDLESVNAYDSVTLGIHRKEYWVKFEIEEPNLLNSFLFSWVVQGRSIAGIRGSVLDYGGICSKEELKDKLIKMIKEL